jgi:uncharacterized membrane protein
VKKVDFIAELRSNLGSFSGEEREDIIRDQEEYIRDAISAGRDEEAVIDSLGDPRVLAGQLTVQTKIDRVEKSSRLPVQMRNLFGAVRAILALAPFNIIFVLGPFLFLFAMNMAGWAVSFAMLLSAVAVLGVFLFKLSFFVVGMYTHLSALFLCLGLIGLGCLGVMLMFTLTRFFFNATATYLKWNLKVIEGKV